LHAPPRRARLKCEVTSVKLKRLKERYVVDEHGHKTAVVLDLKEYQEMLDWLETLEDTLDLDEAVRQARRFRDYREIRQELQKAGRL
jgi:PHD/YefM family antitoxin component YafN of YafNO toxin-antitoxin module